MYEEEDEEASGGSSNIINLSTRTIVLYDFIDENISANVANSLSLLDSIREAPIQIKINSMGGLMVDSQSIISDIMSCKNKVITDITGCAYSGAAMIALAGTYRKISKLGLMMLHYPNWETETMSLKQHKLDVAVMSEYFKRIMVELLKDTKIDITKFSRMAAKGDVYLTPEECFKLGIVHEIY